ncbi:MAG TPA: hypothetical protein VGO60_12355, partial [Iamia sp.]|nr:hypothetical protein [Iamia sp.]
IGANDAKFSDVVKACLLQSDCSKDGPGDTGKVLFERQRGNIERNYVLLDARLDRMARQQAGDARLRGKVFFTQYFDVTKADSGAYCTGQTPGEIADRVDTPYGNTNGMTAVELEWADKSVQDGLNTHVENGIDAGNATNPTTGAQMVFVDGIKPEFAKNGYCANDRYVRTLAESFLYQRGQDGAFHPNVEGHLYGYAKHIEEDLAPALGVGGTALPFESPEAEQLGDALSSWMGFMDKTGGLDAALGALPFGARDKVQAWMRDKVFDKLIPFIANRIEAARGSVTELAEILDDPDGDGNPGVDFTGLGNLNIDVTGDIQPRSPSKTYTITFGITGSVTPDAGLALAAGDLGLIDGPTASTAQFSQQVTLKVDLTKPAGARLSIPDGGYTGSFDLGIDADFGGTDGAAHGPDQPALAFKAGALGLGATGPVHAQVGVDVTIEDPDGDGDVDATEIGNPADWIDVECTSGAAHVDLTARAALAGLSSKLGRITLDDADLCDGVDPPTVDLSQLGELDNIDLVELVNGIAQLATSLQGIQDQADIDIPFVRESLSGLIAANDRLKKFFVDNGLTDADNPLARITYNPRDARFEGLDTLDELLPKLGQALGIPSYTPTIVDGSLRFDLSRVIDPAPITGGGTLDFSDQLSRTGLTDVVGTTKATIDPRLALNLGIGIDLGEDTEFADRFFFQLAPEGTPELSGDATVTVDASLRGKLGILGIELADTATGPITLLDRKTTGVPMLSVDLRTKDGDGRLTLREIATPGTGAAATIVPTVSAKVPAFGLTATAKLGGAPLASGRVDVSWPDISDPRTLAVGVDTAFTGSLLPFAFDPDNPRATITSFLTAAHTGVSNLRLALEEDADAVRALPLVGDDLTELDPLLAEIEDGLADLIELDSILTLENAEAKVEALVGQALHVTNTRWPGILTVSLIPRTATTRAALQAQLNVSICSPGRTTLPGCASAGAGPQLTLPLNLKVGSATDSPVAVGADATGEVTVDYDARLSLGIGVELPNVSLAAPGDLPDALEGDGPELYVVDTSSFELGLGATVSGRFGAILGPVKVDVGRPAPAAAATASLAARYVLKSRTAVPAAPKRISTENLDDWIDTIDPDPTTNGGIHDTTTPASCPAGPAPAGIPDACATLPIVINDLYAGDITFRAPDLLSPGGWSYDTGTVLDRLSSSDFQFALLVNGLSAFTERLETSIRALPAGRNVPLLGTDPTATADVLKSFRDNFVTPVDSLVTQLNDNAATTGNVKTQVQDFLWERIGPPSTVKLLKDGSDGGTDLTKDDIQVILLCGTATNQTSCAPSASLTTLQDLQIRVSLGKDLSATTEPLDSGFPGLRLKSEEGFSANLGFTMDLAVGIDRKIGFYIPTRTGNLPELRVEATASLPAQISGELAFIPVTLDDLNAGKPDVAASVGLDFVSGGQDQKVSIGELGSIGIEPDLTACANVRLGLATGGDARFPKFKADLGLVGGYDCEAGGATGAPETDADIDITFDDVRVNAGSFLKDLAAPAAEQLIDFVGPVRPALDALEEPIPGIAEAARAAGQHAPTWWELMEAYDAANGGGDDLSMLRKIRFLIQTADALAAQPGTGLDDISLGSFDVDTAKAQDPASARDASGLVANPLVDAAGSIIDHLHEAGVPLEIVDRLEPEAKYHSLTFPAFENPKSLFGMLLGQDVPLIRFEAGGSFVHVPIGPYTFPVGPATLYLGGGLDIRGHFAAGYDTYGIRQVYSFLTDDDPTNDSVGALAEGLLGGLYLDDYDASGKDVPELLVRAEIVAGAGIGIPGFGVFAEGGVTGRADVDLDTDNRITKGKLRIPEAVAQLRLNPNPACFFKASAKIEAFVRVVVQNPIEDVAYPIADATILDQPDLTAFCAKAPPAGAQKDTAFLYSDGTLDLTRSATGNADTIRARQTGPGSFTVFAKGKQEQWDGVTKIFVDAKNGNDTITIEGLPHSGPGIPVHACGGGGKDRISASTGEVALYGDTGPTFVARDGGQDKNLTCATGGPGNDTLTGGPDDDTIVAG